MISILIRWIFDDSRRIIDVVLKFIDLNGISYDVKIYDTLLYSCIVSLRKERVEKNEGMIKWQYIIS